MPEPDLQLRPLEHSETGIREVSELLRHVFPHATHLTPAYLRWRYGDNPLGRALGFNMLHQGRLIAHCAGEPLAARVDGQALRGILFINAAVDPAHVRRNMMRGVTEPLFEAAAAQGFAFAVAVGNARSTRPLLTRFRMVGPLQARLGAGLPRRREEHAAPSYEPLWSEASLRWRLVNPERGYSTRTRDGRAAITSPSGRRGIGAILYDGPDRWGLADAGPAPFGPLRVWLGMDPAMAWARSPFVPLPARLRPSPLNLVFRDLSGGGLFPDPARMVFRALDFDAW